MVTTTTAMVMLTTTTTTIMTKTILVEIMLTEWKTVIVALGVTARPSPLVHQLLLLVHDHPSSLILSVQHEFLLSVESFFLLLPLRHLLLHLLGQLPYEKDDDEEEEE